MEAEKYRLSFIEGRDGKEAAIEFAKQTAAIYKRAVLMSKKRGFVKPHFASLPEYRRSFIESYCILKAYLAKNESK